MNSLYLDSNEIEDVILQLIDDWKLAILRSNEPTTIKIYELCIKQLTDKMKFDMDKALSKYLHRCLADYVAN